MERPYNPTVPDELGAHVTQILREDGVRWLNGLPELIRRLEQDWSVRVGKPFAGAEFNYVAPAVGDNGETVVVKIAPPYVDGEAYSEVAWLRQRAGKGCIRLLAEDRTAKAMLLERAVPGRSLAEGFIGRESEIVSSAIGVLSSIQMAPPQDIEDVIYLSRWFSNLERCKGSTFPAAYSDRALSFYHDLSARAPSAYLHGDFHPGNIVAATREPFLVIDPKGIVGPLGYDIAVFLNNLYWGQKDEVEKTLVRRNLEYAINEFSSAFAISTIDLRKWAFATQVLGAWWTFDEMPDLYDHEVEKADIWDV